MSWNGRSPKESASGVSPRQLQAIVMLAEGLGTSEVAERLGCNPRTIRKWRERPEFRAELDRLQREATRTAIASLRAHAIHASRALGRIVTDRDAAPTARVSAARVVLDSVWKAEEVDRLTEIEARLDRLEAQQGGAA